MSRPGIEPRSAEQAFTLPRTIRTAYTVKILDLVRNVTKFVSPMLRQMR
jgi:hypothetical protein